MAVQRISPQEAKRLIEEGAKVVDVREDDERAACSIAGSEHAPFSSFEHDQSGVEQSPVAIFHCAHGRRGQLAAEIYAEQNPQSQVFNIDGGLSNWEADGQPTEGSTVDAPSHHPA